MHKVHDRCSQRYPSASRLLLILAFKFGPVERRPLPIAYVVVVRNTLTGPVLPLLPFLGVIQSGKQSGTDHGLFSTPLLAGTAFVIGARLFRENTVCKQALKSSQIFAASHSTNKPPRRFGLRPARQTKLPDAVLQRDCRNLRTQFLNDP